MDDAVLIVDGNRARAQRIGEACAARGFSTGFARNGPEALEVALSEVPDVLIAGSDMELIDGPRLEEILRANPRTQDVRFLFLDGKSQDPGGPLHEALPSTSDADDVAMRVEAMLAHRARVDAVEREDAADHEVEGNFSQIPLTDLLQLFHMNRQTGILEVSRREPGGREDRGTLWIRDGSLLHATAGRVEGEKALFRVLAWHDGRFAFTPNPVTEAPRIHTPTRALLLEGVRQLDEWNRMRNTLPPLDGQVTLTVTKGDLPNEAHPVTQEVLLLLEIHDLVRDVVDHCSHPDYQVLRTLQNLAERGIVRLSREPDGAEERGRALFSPHQVRRLRDWLQTGRPRGAALFDAKLLLVSNNADTTRAFCQVLRTVPGMDLTPRFTRERFAADDVVPMGRLLVGDGLGIRLVHVPSHPDFAPVWPVAFHGALGALILLSDADETAEAALQPVTEVLRAQPRARLFHVLLLGKEDPVDAQTIRGRLSLMDQASLFLVHLERAKESTTLLQTMFARVLP